MQNKIEKYLGEKNKKLFLLGFMDFELEKKYRKLVLHRITVERLLYIQRWKNNEIPNFISKTLILNWLLEMP